MRDFEEESYKRYKQYRRNRYRYEQEQIIFPLMIILVGAVIISFWKRVVIATIIVVLIVLAFLLYKKFRKKQMKAEQSLILTKEEAQQGSEYEIIIKNTIKPTTINIVTPPNAKDGQRFCVKNIEIENEQGKREKKNIWFRIKVKE